MNPFPSLYASHPTQHTMALLRPEWVITPGRVFSAQENFLEVMAS